MSGRHRLPHSKSNLLIGSIAASVGVSSVLAAAIVELVAPEPSTTPAALDQSVTQQGRLIAVTDDSLTAQSANGLIRTYALTPNTAGITDGSGQTLSTPASFAVNDEVAIVGSRQNGSLVATAVTEAGPAGRPMDFGV
jgi:hypothetical protein